MPRALVFQHMDDEPPGLFGGFLGEAGYTLDTIMLHRGEAIPALALYDFLLVMGGAMDVWEEEAHPWLVPEKQAIRDWALHRNRPFFGVCLGMQLLAEALGGKVGLAKEAEVGVGQVTLTATGKGLGLPKVFPVMQWHHAEVTELPAGAEVLASSPTTRVQIMRVGGHLLGTQFHGELTPALLNRWADIPQYLAWLDEALGPNAYPRVKLRALPLMPEMARNSRILLNAVLQKSRRAAA